MAIPVRLRSMPEHIRVQYGFPCTQVEPSAQRQQRIDDSQEMYEDLQMLRFPKSKVVLWDHTVTGPPVILHFAQYRKPRICVSEKVLRIAHRQCMSCGRSLDCVLIGTLCVEDDGEGLLFSIDRLDCRPGSMSTMKNLAPGDVMIPLKVSVNGTGGNNSTSEDYTTALKLLKQRCESKDTVDVCNFLLTKGWCNFRGQGEQYVAHLDFDVVTLGTSLKVSPISPVPIVPTALSKNLAGPKSISHIQGMPKSGYLTMDHTRKLLLVLDSDPKALNLPAVGIWVSGVPQIHHPFVWASCVRYLHNKMLQDRVCTPPEAFLIVLYNPLHSHPEFYECHTLAGHNRLEFDLLSGYEAINLNTSVVSQQHGIVDCELEQEQPGKKREVFDAALTQTRNQLIKESVQHRGTDSGLATEDIVPRLTPAPHQAQMSSVQPMVPEVSLYFGDSPQSIGSNNSSIPQGNVPNLARHMTFSPPVTSAENGDHVDSETPRSRPPMSQSNLPSQKQVAFTGRSDEQEPSPRVQGYASQGTRQDHNSVGLADRTSQRGPYPQGQYVQNGQLKQNDVPSVGEKLGHAYNCPCCSNQSSNNSHPNQNGQFMSQRTLVNVNQKCHSQNQIGHLYGGRPHVPNSVVSPHQSNSAYPHPAVQQPHPRPPPPQRVPGPSIPHFPHPQSTPESQGFQANPHMLPPSYHPASTSSVPTLHTQTKSAFTPNPLCGQEGHTASGSTVQQQCPLPHPQLSHQQPHPQLSHQQPHPYPSTMQPHLQLQQLQTQPHLLQQQQHQQQLGGFPQEQLPGFVAPSQTSYTSSRNHDSTCSGKSSDDSGLSVTPERSNASPKTGSPNTPDKTSCSHPASASLDTINWEQVPPEIYQLIMTQNAQLQQLQAQMQQLLQKQSPSLQATQQESGLGASPSMKETCEMAVNTTLFYPGPEAPKRDVHTVSLQTSPEKTLSSPQSCHASSHLSRQHSQPGSNSQTPVEIRHTGVLPLNSTRRDDTEHHEITPGDLTGVVDNMALHNQTVDSVQSELVLDMPSYQSSPTSRSQKECGSLDGSYQTSPLSASMCANTKETSSQEDDSKDGSGPVDEAYYEHLLVNIRQLLNNHSDGSGTLTETMELHVPDTTESSHGTDATSVPSSPQYFQNTRTGINAEHRNFTQLQVRNGADTTFIPCINYLSMMMESDSDTSMEINAMALKYLSDEQLTQLGKLRKTSGVSRQLSKSALLRQVMLGDSVDSPDESQYGLSSSNITMGTQKYLEKYGLLSNAGDATGERIGDETLQLKMDYSVASTPVRPRKEDRYGSPVLSRGDNYGLQAREDHQVNGGVCTPRREGSVDGCGSNEFSERVSNNSGYSANSSGMRSPIKKDFVTYSPQGRNNYRATSPAKRRISPPETMHREDMEGSPVLHNAYRQTQEPYNEHMYPSTNTSEFRVFGTPEPPENILDIDKLRQLPKLL